MRAPILPRRMALLGGAALLSGCSAFDFLGDRKQPLPGERRSVLRADPPLTADQQVAPVTLPPPERRTDWPQAGGPPSHAPGHVALGEGLTSAWRSSVGYGSGYRQRITTGPVAAGGTVYAVDAYGVVSAFSLADGSRLWRTDTAREDEADGAVGGGVAVEAGTVYVATGLADVLALSPEDGTVRWRIRLPAPTRGAPTVAGGRIFIPTVENHLIALSAEDGRQLWRHRAQALATLPFGLPAPAVEGETVVAGFGTGELVALRASDGRVLWAEALGGTGGQLSLADIVGITGLPVVDRGRVFAVGLANTTVAVDLRSGRRLWERSFGGNAGPVSAGDWLFCVTGAGEAVAIGRTDGRIRWVTELDPTPEGGRRGEAARFAPPLLAGGRLLIPSSRAEMLVVNPASGEVAGRISLSSGVTLPGAISGDTLLLLGDDGTLMALRPGG